MDLVDPNLFVCLFVFYFLRQVFSVTLFLFVFLRQGFSVALKPFLEGALVYQAGLELTEVHLPLPPKCCN